MLFEVRDPCLLSDRISNYVLAHTETVDRSGPLNLVSAIQATHVRELYNNLSVISIGLLGCPPEDQIRSAEVPM